MCSNRTRRRGLGLTNMLSESAGKAEIETQSRLSCPACGSEIHERVGGYAPPISLVLAGQSCQLGSYHIRKCSRCELYFKSDVMTENSLGRYYDALDYHIFEFEDEFPTDRVARESIDRLEDGAVVLDFGCSTGRILKGRTSRLDCRGVEPNAAAAAMASDRGIQIHDEGSVFLGMKGQVDLVLLADVFEHLPSPLSTLERLASLLSPRGRILIVTGNADAVLTPSRMGEFWYFRIEGHLQMMSEKHAAWLAEHLGLELSGIRRCSHYSTSLPTRLRQMVQDFAYSEFKDRPQSRFSRLMRRLPWVRRAEFWPNAPALTCTKDHLVVTLARRGGFEAPWTRS